MNHEMTGKFYKLVVTGVESCYSNRGELRLLELAVLVTYCLRTDGRVRKNSKSILYTPSNQCAKCVLRHPSW